MQTSRQMVHQLTQLMKVFHLKTRHNFEVGEGIIYDARGNTPIVNIVEWI